MHSLYNLLPIQRDSDKNLPRLHFDAETQKTTVTRVSINQWVLRQRNNPAVEEILQSLPLVAMTAIMNKTSTVEKGKDIVLEALDAMDQAAIDIHDIALEFAYDPTCDEKTSDACRLIIQQRLREVQAKYDPTVQVLMDEVLKDRSTTERLSDVLRSAALINTTIDMITGRVPRDTKRLLAMTEVSMDDFPKPIQIMMKKVIDELRKQPKP